MQLLRCWNRRKCSRNVTSASDLPLNLSFEDLRKLFGEYQSFRRIAVGVSGGADSMALLYLLYQWGQQEVGKTPELCVFTVDHGLRRESAAEADGVARYCQGLGVLHKTLHWQGAKPSSNIQAIARKARHGLLRDAARDYGCDALFLAHHLEDQAETFLTRLARGSGVYGLSSIRDAREIEGLLICRPLLSVSKTRLIEVLENAGINWFEDPSNENEHYTRVRFRKAQKELAALGLTPLKLAGTAHRMARAADAIDAWVDDLAEKSCSFHSAGPVRFESRCLEYLPQEAGLRLIGRLVRYVSGAAYTPRLSKLEGLYEVLRDEGHSHAATLGGVRFVLAKPYGDQVWFCFREAGA